jgi:hypothetical protein
MEPEEPVRGTYQHYKGGFYLVLGIASDPTREGGFVVYQSLGIAEDLTGEQERRVVRTGNSGALSVCPVERFTEPVTDKAHTGGKPVPRFTLINRMPSE